MLEQRISSKDDVLYINRFLTGLYTNRSPLVLPSVGGVDRLDTVIDGSNMELGDDLIWRRRAGLSNYSLAALTSTEIPRRFHSWRSFTGLEGTFIDLGVDIKLLDLTGAVIATIDTDDAADKASFVSIGSTTYIANGIDRKKYLAGSVYNWGIVAATTAPVFGGGTVFSEGPNSAGLGQSVAGADSDWANPTNIYLSDNARASSSLAAYSYTDYLRTTAFGFSIPVDATICGIKDEFERSASFVDPWARDLTVKVVKAGAETGTNQALTTENWPLDDAYAIYGGNSDLRGTTWTPTEINAADSGVSIKAQSGSGGNVVRVDYVRRTVYYTASMLAGDLSPTVGYKYVYCGKCTLTGHVSTASPQSVSTGPQTNKQFVVSGDHFTDTQVDTVEIYRTLDGGSTFYFLTSVANPGSGTWQYTDNIPDSSLNQGKTAPMNSLNDPPPVGLKNICFHLGRVWGSVGNKVYFCSGSDVLNGVPEEAWYPLNYYSVQGTVTHLLPVQFGLLAFTPGDIYVMRGMTKETFTPPQIWIGGVGILTPTAAELHGGTLFIYSTASQLLAIGTEIENPGFIISNTVFPDFNPTDVHLTVHKATDKDAAIYLSNGTSKIARLSLSLKSWSTVATITGGCKAIKSIETASGVYTLLMGRATGSGYILKRNIATNADAGTGFTASVTFGSLVLALPGHLVDVESILIEHGAVGTYPTVSILPSEISGTFVALPDPVDEPPSLPASTTVIAKRHYLKAIAGPTPAWMRHMQLKLSWPAENAANELLSFAICRKSTR
jgi:hypothetical protein